MKEKYPIKIVVDKENQFKAATSLNKIVDDSKNTRKELSYVEGDYTTLIDTTRRLLAISSKKGVDPRLFWLIGENIVRFLERLNEIGFYLMQQNRTLARDIGISESSIEKILSFRKRFPSISLINPEISWAKYRDNKVPFLKERE
jgi:hypothetical protein